MKELILNVLTGMVVVVSVTSASFAQDAPVKPNRAPAPTVTATASGDLVRFTAPADGVQLRVEVYSETGQLVSDSGFVGGNVMDWKWRAALQSWLQDMNYLCLVTVKTLSGQLYQRQGMLSLRDGQASLHADEGERLKPAVVLDM